MVRPQRLCAIFALILVLLSQKGLVVAQENSDASSLSPQNDQPLLQNTIDPNAKNASSQDQTDSASEENGKPTSIDLPSFSYKYTKESLVSRSFVLSIGLFPFSYFYVGTALDIVRFASHDFSADYAPWPFKTQYSVALTNEEIWWKLGIASGTSVLFGILGAILK